MVAGTSVPSDEPVGAAMQNRDLAAVAFRLLRTAFGVAPILFGVDKFFNWMVQWPIYLWSGVADFLPGTAQQIMYGVGAVEIVAGLVVLVAPRIGGPFVVAWLTAVVTNLVIVSWLTQNDFWDIALRDVGLIAAAAALTLLAFQYHEERQPPRT